MRFLKKKEIDDIIIFGSFIKGKDKAEDIDVAVLFSNFSRNIWMEINNIGENYHLVKTKFSNILEEPMLWQTLIHEGYSLKHNAMLSNIIGIKPNFLFEYELDKLDKTNKQTFSHALYGTGGRKSFLKSIKGTKLGNKKVLVPFDKSEEIREFFNTWKIAYTVKRIWM